MTDDQSAENALKSIRDAQMNAMDVFSRRTWGYDVVYACLVAALVGAPAAGVFWAIPIELTVTVALTVLAVFWAKKHGVWISGIRPKKARWVAVSLGIVMFAAYLGGLIAITGFGAPRWVALVTAGAAFIAAIIGSRQWRATYRREMGLDL